MVLWGYRSDEVWLPEIWPLLTSNNKDQITLDPSFKLEKLTENDRNLRRPVAGTLGMHLEGAACPHPDLTDVSTSLDGFKYRVCPRLPGFDKIKARALRRFTLKFCKKHLTPLAASSDISVEAWLAKTNYTQKRKDELLSKYHKITNPFDTKYTFIKSFIKDEFYPDYKHARTINSRTDEYKTLVGPIFQLISDEVFKLKYFIKKIPVDERPKFIYDRFSRRRYVYSTDFSSFEAHFIKLLMENCEFVLYEYMIQNLPTKEEFMRHVRAMTRENRIEFQKFLVKILAKRMSGEMCTSLGNGFTNLMLILYICWVNDALNDPEPYVEGDDSLFGADTEITTNDFKAFGLRIKIEQHTDVCRASFCGMVFDREDMTNVSDPREVLATFGWTTFKYIRSKKSIHNILLRCKALSLAYQYPSCPILSKLAQNVLRLTRHNQIENFIEKQGTKFLCNYEMELLLEAQMKNKQGQLIFKEPGANTRKLVEELYNIPIDDQHAMEKYFDDMTEIGPIKGELFLQHMPSVWIDYYAKYSGNVSPKMAVFEHPGPLWPKIKERCLTRLAS